VHLAFRALPPAQAAEEALEALAVIQDVLTGQQGIARAEFQSAWLEEAQFVTGRLIELGAVESAFDLAEQRRAQILLEEIERAGNTPLQVSPTLALQQAEIVSTQRQLVKPGLSSERRSMLEAQLRNLELGEEDLREQLNSRSEGRPQSRAASLRQIQAALHDNEVLLSYVVGLDRDLYGERGSGAWVFYVSRATVGAEKILDRAALDPLLRVYRGMFRPGASWRPAAARRLAAALLQPALQYLPEAIDTVLIAPDDLLYDLPFESLLEAANEADAPGPDYRLAIVPSASIWHRLRSERATEEGAVLLIGDPAGAGQIRSYLGARPAQSAAAESIPQGLPGPNQPAGDDLYSRVEGLPRLPWAVLELKAARKLLGGGTVLHGKHASELELKQRLASVRPTALLHVAAHALVDPRDPDRSSIVLTPGSVDEDGLLQTREIVQLDLAGSLVVLSACQTAAGRLVHSEGILSLGRAFFRAGARSVLATRWPVRDDHAEHFLTLVYGHLAAGQTLGEALHRARGEARAQGMQAETWAAFALLGDPRTTVVLPGRPSMERALMHRAFMLLAAAAALVAAGAWLIKRRRKARSHSARS
jgi:CHAT domain-containing protein